MLFAMDGDFKQSGQGTIVLVIATNEHVRRAHSKPPVACPMIWAKSTIIRSARRMRATV